MKKLILVLSLFSLSASAAPVKRLFQDAKLPTQQLVEKQDITNPAAAGSTQVLSGNAGNTSTAAASATTFVSQPDVSRNLVITPGGTTADVAACSVTVTGTDYFGKALSESFSFLANASTATVGSKAFKTVSQVSFPANCEDSPFTATWSVGFGEKLGLKRCMAQPGHVLMTTIDGAYEATRPTVAANVSQVSQNTVDVNGTMNGASDFEVFFFQNYGCFP